MKMMIICFYRWKKQILVLVLLALSIHLVNSDGQLQLGFYSQTCPNAESVVASVVRQASITDQRMTAMLLRLHFHDCFVQGCDGSILIENVEDRENKAFGHEGLGGFREIEKAKAQLEAECPGVVSCADIIALAARDAVVLSGGLSYQVETGRRDGRISNISLAADMPDVNDPIQTLKAKFANKGLSDRDFVLLSAAHTIGTTACFFMPKRLYNFTGNDDSDPAINPQLLSKLKAQCPAHGDVNVRVPLDATSSQTFDDQILRNIKQGLAVISSDARLYDDNSTRLLVDSYVDNRSGPSFLQDFGAAMVNMGRIGVSTGSQGEIRRVCSSFN